ncbi:MAG: YetF domain-containing protein [Syntrophomonadaceae bacterium]
MDEALVVVVRSLIAFFTLLILARVLGKQQISQLTFFDYVLGITIGSIAASLSVDLSSRAWPHWIGIITWAIAVVILQYISFLSKRSQRYLTGVPTIVIMNGKILEQNMYKLRYTTSDLLEQLRDKNVFDLTRVAFAVLENNGQLSVLLKPQYQPVTPSDLNISPKNAGLNNELIYNGLIIEENLAKTGVDRVWLEQQLRAQGISSYTDVFIASYDSTSGNLYIDKYIDNLTEGE